MKEHLDRLDEIFNAGDWSKGDRAAYEAVSAVARAAADKDDVAERALCFAAVGEDWYPATEIAACIESKREQARAEGYARALEQGVLSRAFQAGVDEGLRRSAAHKIVLGED